MKNRVAVLVSGKSTQLDEMINVGIEIDLVLADRKCEGLKIAQDADIPTELLWRIVFGPGSNRYGCTTRVIDTLLQYRIDLVVIAGFMTLLDPIIFIKGYGDRILNTRLSFSSDPQEKMLIKPVLATSITFTGCTVCVVTENLDGGKVVAQERVSIVSGETEKIFHERVNVTRHQLYSRVIRERAVRPVQQA